MLLNYFFVCSGFLGLVNFILFLIYFKNNKTINLQLLLLLLCLSLNFILISLREVLNPINLILESSIYDCLFVFIPTLLYLYVKNIENDIKHISKNNYKHYTFLFTIIASTSCFRSPFNNLDLIKILLILISLFYYYKTFDLIKNRIYTNRAGLKLLDAENEITNKWIVFIFLLSLTNLIQMILVADFYYETKSKGLVSSCIGALIFNVVLIKNFSRPEIVYGNKVKNNTLKKIEPFELKYGYLWVKIPTKKITNSQDVVLFENIKDKIQVYCNKIDNLVLETKILRKSTITLNEIAILSEIPKSHLTFLFKYHCKINFADYKKLVRIHDSFFIINEGFLKNNTLESLSVKVGFSSYNPFYIAFKKITNTTPQLYSKNHI